MEITYNKGYRRSEQGNGWVLYSDVKMKDSLIVHALESLVLKNTDKTYDEIYDLIEERYRNKKEKSSCRISKDHTSIDITVKGVFPRFYLYKVKEYFFCNENFIKEFGACQKSNPLDRFGEKVYIVELTWFSVKKWIDKKGEDFFFENDIWVWKIEGGIESEWYDFKEIKEQGFFEWIDFYHNLGKESNQAQIINTVCRYENCTPIELFNKLGKAENQN